jgi:hypothetical protein
LKEAELNRSRAIVFIFPRTLINIASSAALQIDYTVSEDAGIIVRTVRLLHWLSDALTTRLDARSHPQTRIDLFHIKRVADPDSGVKIALKILKKYIL